MARKNFQKGFAALETILIIIILAIIGFTGWYVWHSSEQAKDTYSSASHTAQSHSATTEKTTQKYLTIKQWDVKVPLSSGIADAYYLYKSGNDTAYLSKAIYEGTNCAADQTTLGAIVRFTADQKDSLNDGTMLSEHTDAVKIGDYYYFYMHPQAACDGGSTNSMADFNDNKANVAGQQMQDFRQAVSKITVS